MLMNLKAKRLWAGILAAVVVASIVGMSEHATSGAMAAPTGPETVVIASVQTTPTTIAQ